MASPSSAKATTFALPRLRDLIEHDDEDDDDFVEEEGSEEEEEEWGEDVSKRMSRLFVEGSDGGDADDEDEGGGGGGDEEDDDEVKSDGVNQPWNPYEEGSGTRGGLLQAPSSASLPGTPERGAPPKSPWRYSKDYASETEAARWWRPGGGPHDNRRQQHHRRQRMMREVWLDRAWQMRKQRRQLGERGADVTALVSGEPPSSSPGRGGVVDMDEVRACRDLGLDLPCDWTVEIPCYAVSVSNADTASSGGNSPASATWPISSPGDDPNDVKARLKVWAQAVALSSASRLGS